MSIVKILNAINKIHSDVNIRLDAIENELAIIRCKCENIDTIIQKGKHNVGNGEANQQIKSLDTISSPEDIIKYLNDSTSTDQREPYTNVINNRCVIEFNNIHSVLKQDISIYDLIIDIIYEIENDNNARSIYAYESEKSPLFYWNQEKHTWSKMGKKELKDIFTSIQYKIIQKYQQLLSQDNQIKNECVENGDYIWNPPSFDKEYSTFRKSLISKLL